MDEIEDRDLNQEKKKKKKRSYDTKRITPPALDYTPKLRSAVQDDKRRPSRRPLRPPLSGRWGCYDKSRER
jgi:hypothetical protein